MNKINVAKKNTIQRHMTIDLLTSYHDLIQQWRNGNREVVIEALRDDHSALTAMFMAQGMAEGRLTQSDLNIVANLLIDERRNLCIG